MLRKGMCRSLSEWGSLKKNHRLQNCVKVSPLGRKKTQGNLFYLLHWFFFFFFIKSLALEGCKGAMLWPGAVSMGIFIFFLPKLQLLVAWKTSVISLPPRDVIHFNLPPSALNLAFMYPHYFGHWTNWLYGKGFSQSFSHTRGLRITSQELCIYCSWPTAILLSKVWVAWCPNPAKGTIWAGAAITIPTWLTHLVLGMNLSNLPPRIWERWVNSSSLICDPSPAWETIEIKPSLKVERTELSSRDLLRKVCSCLQVYWGGSRQGSIKIHLGTARPGALPSIMGFRALSSSDVVNGRPRFPAGTERIGAFMF